MSAFRKIPVATLFAATAIGAQTYYGNGYTIVEGTDSGQLASDLDAKVFKTINAYSVEDGLRQLLAGSGWELAQPVHADPQIWRLYRQPWPDNKRTISPMPLGEALSWIAGDGWTLVADPVNRLVSFEVAPRYTRVIAPARPTASPSATTPSSSAIPVTAYNNGDVYADIPPGSSQPSLQVPYGSSYGTSSYGNSYSLSVQPLTAPVQGTTGSNNRRDQHYAASGDSYGSGQTYFADSVTRRSTQITSRRSKSKERKERTALRPAMDGAAVRTSVTTRPVAEKKVAAKTPTASKESAAAAESTTKTATAAKDSKPGSSKKAAAHGQAATTDKATGKTANPATGKAASGKEAATPPPANKTATEKTAANPEKQP